MSVCCLFLYQECSNLILEQLKGKNVRGVWVALLL